MTVKLGFWARNLRIYLELTQKELAKLAKVSPRAVDLLEHNQPLPLDDKRKILKELYAMKVRRSWYDSSHYTKGANRVY